MRLFVAIRPPAPVRDALLDAMDERPGVRWQDEDQLHLTLAFLGEVDPRVEQDLVDSLAAIRLPPSRFCPAIPWPTISPLSATEPLL